MELFAHPTGDPLRAIAEWKGSSFDFAKAEDRDDTYNIRARVWDYTHAADNGWIKAKVEPGAFNKHLRFLKELGRNPIMLEDHNHSKKVGTWEEVGTKSGALCAQGFIDTSSDYRKDIARLCERKVIAAVSIGMRFTDAEYNEDDQMFIVKEAEVNEISLVGCPAHEYAKIFSGDLAAAAFGRKEPTAPTAPAASHESFTEADLRKMAKQLQEFTAVAKQTDPSLFASTGAQQ